jgi:hypothetical protein
MTRAGELMSVGWLTWSNPVAIWWSFLLAVSATNIALWLWLQCRLRARTRERPPGTSRAEWLVLLCAAYVFVCAFRSVLPRADVQRIGLFDTWLSSVFVGRSLATVAEICFAAQWAIVLRELARLTDSAAARSISTAIVPLILVAECWSWYAVVTTSYLGNALENSLWAVTFLLIAAALLRLLKEFGGVAQLAIGSAVIGIAGYVFFMITVDVPMYLGRWQADVANGKELLGVLAGLHDVATRWAVTRDIAQWKDEIAWMSLYFSIAVWSSLALGAFGLVQDRMPHYRTRPARSSPASRPLRGSTPLRRPGAARYSAPPPRS